MGSGIFTGHYKVLLDCLGAFRSTPWMKRALRKCLILSQPTSWFKQKLQRQIVCPKYSGAFWDMIGPLKVLWRHSKNSWMKVRPPALCRASVCTCFRCYKIDIIIFILESIDVKYIPHHRVNQFLLTCGPLVQILFFLTRFAGMPLLPRKSAEQVDLLKGRRDSWSKFHLIDTPYLSSMQEFLKEFCAEDDWAENRRKALKARIGKSNPRVLSLISPNCFVFKNAKFSVDEIYWDDGLWIVHVVCTLGPSSLFIPDPPGRGDNISEHEANT